MPRHTETPAQTDALDTRLGQLTWHALDVARHLGRVEAGDRDVLYSLGHAWAPLVRGVAHLAEWHGPGELPEVEAVGAPYGDPRALVWGATSALSDLLAALWARRWDAVPERLARTEARLVALLEAHGIAPAHLHPAPPAVDDEPRHAAPRV